MTRGRKPKCFGDYGGESVLKRFTRKGYEQEPGWSDGHFYCISWCPRMLDCAEATDNKFALGE